MVCVHNNHIQVYNCTQQTHTVIFCHVCCGIELGIYIRKANASQYGLHALTRTRFRCRLDLRLTICNRRFAPTFHFILHHRLQELGHNIILYLLNSFSDAMHALLLVPLVLADLLQHFSCFKTLPFAHLELSLYVVATDHIEDLAKLVKAPLDCATVNASQWGLDDCIVRLL